MTKLLQEKQRALVELQKGRVDKEALLRMRSLLKADIALGKPSRSGEAEDLQAEIEKAESQAEMIQDTADTISGLD